jgi:hypothetical protein
MPGIVFTALNFLHNLQMRMLQNARLKGVASYKHSSLFGPIVVKKKNKVL